MINQLVILHKYIHTHINGETSKAVSQMKHNSRRKYRLNLKNKKSYKSSTNHPINHPSTINPKVSTPFPEFTVAELVHKVFYLIVYKWDSRVTCCGIKRPCFTALSTHRRVGLNAETDSALMPLTAS